MANGSKIAMPEQSDPEKALRGNSPVPDQDLGYGVSIKDGVLVGLKFEGGSIIDTNEIIELLKEKMVRDLKFLNEFPGSVGKLNSRTQIDQKLRKKLMFGS